MVDFRIFTREWGGGGNFFGFFYALQHDKPTLKSVDSPVVSFSVDPFSKWENNEFDIVVSSESVTISLQRCCLMAKDTGTNGFV